MGPIRYCMVALIPVFAMIQAPAGTASATSWDEAKVISEATGGRFDNRAGSYFDKDCNQDTPYENDVVDLNGDGQPEVFVVIHGTCWGGMTGVNVDLLIKGADGKWASQFGFPGIYRVLDTNNKGFPDIEFGGPGSCFPIWRWNGRQYAIHKKCAW